MAEIDQFISVVRKEGLARNNRFVVYITPPSSLLGAMPDVKLRFLCDTATIPGMNFLSNPVTTYGEQREVVYNRSFEPINLEFMLDQSMEIKRFFDDWQAKIVDPISRTVSYYQDYIGIIEIYQLDYSDKEQWRYAARIHEAFPKSVAAISYTAGGKDVSKLSVSIEYKYWTPLVQLTADEQTSSAPMTRSGVGVSNANPFARGLNGQVPLDIPNEGSEETPQ